VLRITIEGYCCTSLPLTTEDCPAHLVIRGDESGIGARQFGIEEFLCMTVRFDRRGLETGDPIWSSLASQAAGQLPWVALRMDRKLRSRGGRDFITDA